MPASFLFWQYGNISILSSSLSCFLAFSCSYAVLMHLIVLLLIFIPSFLEKTVLVAEIPCCTAYLPISALSLGEYLLYLPRCFTVVEHCCCCSTLVTSLLAATIGLDGTESNRLPSGLRRIFSWEEGSRVKYCSIDVLIANASTW